MDCRCIKRLKGTANFTDAGNYHLKYSQILHCANIPLKLYNILSVQYINKTKGLLRINNNFCGT